MTHLVNTLCISKGPLRMVFAFLALSGIILSVPAAAQFSQAARDSINKITQVDYTQMLGQLGLSPADMRRGPSGDPTAPNAANRFEDKVNSYKLPDPLLLNNGKRVAKASEWWSLRRPEIVEFFDREVYGHLPQNLPAVRWQVISVRDTVVGSMPIKEKLLKGVVDNSLYPSIKVEIELLLATPEKATGPVPVVIEFGWIKNPFNRGPVQALGLGSAGEPTWKEQLIMRGWGY
ncbi:MAG TPA: hypothetical protein VK658_17415, partial [Chryseolinea sp.]|nr:hypothetical protein [Chryseolinea sp.]